MDNPIEKITIAPCMGLGQVVAGVTRLAAYIVNEEMLPDKTILLCTPALTAGVIEDIDMVQVYPTIIIDGCGENCASNVCHFFKIKPAARIYVPDIIRKTRLSPGRSRQRIEESGEKLARKIAEKVTMVAEAILNDPDYKFEVQSMDTHDHIHTSKVEQLMDYKHHQDDIYIPHEMPCVNYTHSTKKEEEEYAPKICM